MEVAITSVGFLGTISIILVVGLLICLLAFIGYNVYIKYQDKNKKIEVSAENTNLKNDENE